MQIVFKHTPKYFSAFQDQFVSNFVTENDVVSGIKVPIELVICNECTLVQQCYSAYKTLYYKILVSIGVTETMRSQLQDIIFSCFDEVPMSKNDVILDNEIMMARAQLAKDRHNKGLIPLKF